jgi:hypothetical protein
VTLTTHPESSAEERIGDIAPLSLGTSMAVEEQFFTDLNLGLN